jgi:hypothetical protein
VHALLDRGRGDRHWECHRHAEPDGRERDVGGVGDVDVGRGVGFRFRFGVCGAVRKRDGFGDVVGVGAGEAVGRVGGGVGGFECEPRGGFGVGVGGCGGAEFERRGKARGGCRRGCVGLDGCAVGVG